MPYDGPFEKQEDEDVAYKRFRRLQDRSKAEDAEAEKERKKEEEKNKKKGLLPIVE